VAAEDNGGTAPCPFCAKFEAGLDPHWPWQDHIVIEPLNPLVPGHVLVIPRNHVEDFGQDPITSAMVMARAAALVRPYSEDGASFNIITSIGAAATQTVRHLHVHVVPRTEGDGLKLPWTDRRKVGDDGSRT
jgi:histidine triad (HIT) family protein